VSLLSSTKSMVWKGSKLSSLIIYSFVFLAMAATAVVLFPLIILLAMLYALGLIFFMVL
jgi:hypothetical protein